MSILKNKRVDFNTSYCCNTIENFNQLLKYGSLAYKNQNFKDFKDFPYLILDENEFIDSLDDSAIGYKYKNEITYNKIRNKWEYKEG